MRVSAREPTLSATNPTTDGPGRSFVRSVFQPSLPTPGVAVRALAAERTCIEACQLSAGTRGSKRGKRKKKGNMRRVRHTTNTENGAPKLVHMTAE